MTAPRLFSFEWRMAPPHSDEAEHPRAKHWMSLMGAVKAAAKWTQDMAAEDCAVQTRVVELMPVGSGRQAVPFPGPVGGWA
jgi:hypothetical protein